MRQLIRPANDAGRVTDHHAAGRNIVGDHGARADQRALADDDFREERRVDPDAGASLDGRPLHAVTADRMAIVGDRHAWREEGIVLDDSELRDVDVAMDSNVVANHAAVVDRRVVPDAEVIADGVLLSNHRAMSGLQMMTDARPGVDHAERPNDRMRPEMQGEVGDRPAGLLADPYTRSPITGQPSPVRCTRI